MRELAERESLRLSVFDADADVVTAIVNGLPGAVESAVLDATDPDALVDAISGHDAVANALPYAFNLDVMDACLAAKTHYLDLGGLYHTTREQLRLDDEFDAANRTAVLGMGASPGLTNVAAAKGASELDRVTEVHIRTGTRGGEGFAYSAKTILNELTENPVRYENGELVQVEPLSGRETYTLPDPVGEVAGVFSIHSELATMPFTFPGVETVDFRVAFSPELLDICDALVTLGLTSEEEIEFEGVTITPRAFLDWYLGQRPPPEAVEEWKSFRVDVVGELDGERAHTVHDGRRLTAGRLGPRRDGSLDGRAVRRHYGNRRTRRRADDRCGSTRSGVRPGHGARRAGRARNRHRGNVHITTSWTRNDPTRPYPSVFYDNSWVL